MEVMPAILEPNSQLEFLVVTMDVHREPRLSLDVRKPLVIRNSSVTLSSLRTNCWKESKRYDDGSEKQRG